MKVTKGAIIFWLTVLILLTLIFGSGGGRYLQSLFFVSMILPVVIGTSFFVNEILIPRYLLTERFRSFWLYTFYTLIITLYLESIIFVLAYVYLANYKYSELSLFTPNPFGLAAAMYSVVLLRASYLFYSYNKQLANQNQSDGPQEESDYIDVRANRQNQRIKLDELILVESMSDYVKIFYARDKYLITREKISHLATRLPQNFVRVHRSFIINIDQVETYTREAINISGMEIPISRTYKATALEALN